MAPPGQLALILHAHLPFVRHPEHERFLEEDWLFEALTETYLPLLDVFEGLVRDRIRLRVTLSLSPTLLSMVTDPLLQQRYRRYLDERIEALADEQQRTRSDTAIQSVVKFYRARYTALRDRFRERDHSDVSQSFRRLAEAGHLELVTTAATHGYLPLLAVNEESLYAQLSMAVRTHQRVLGRHPRGIWLPECAYTPGLDRILAEFGFEYFILDSHGLLNADPRPRYGVHRPIRTPAGPVAFGRDFESSREVWAAEGGYPGDPLYRDSTVTPASMCRPPTSRACTTPASPASPDSSTIASPAPPRSRSRTTPGRRASAPPCTPPISSPSAAPSCSGSTRCSIGRR